jgi:hypothetical protein
MEPKDKFGRPIYGPTWRKILDCGNRLMNAGYAESPLKPNLFLRRVDVQQPSTGSGDSGQQVSAHVTCTFYAERV